VIGWAGLTRPAVERNHRHHVQAGMGLSLQQGSYVGAVNFDGIGILHRNRRGEVVGAGKQRRHAQKSSRLDHIHDDILERDAGNAHIHASKLHQVSTPPGITGLENGFALGKTPQRDLLRQHLPFIGVQQRKEGYLVENIRINHNAPCRFLGSFRVESHASNAVSLPVDIIGTTLADG
jgi:hypothetical protein